MKQKESKLEEDWMEELRKMAREVGMVPISSKPSQQEFRSLDLEGIKLAIEQIYNLIDSMTLDNDNDYMPKIDSQIELIQYYLDNFKKLQEEAKQYE